MIQLQNMPWKKRKKKAKLTTSLLNPLKLNSMRKSRTDAPEFLIVLGREQRVAVAVAALLVFAAVDVAEGGFALALVGRSRCCWCCWCF